MTFRTPQLSKSVAKWLSRLFKHRVKSMENRQDEMAAKKEKLQIRLTDTQVARVEKLAGYLGSKSPDVFREAIDLGLDELEQRVTRHLNFQNALAVKVKLSRRILPLHEAIAALEAAGDKPEVVALLKESIGE
jgi:hypothetical protein